MLLSHRMSLRESSEDCLGLADLQRKHLICRRWVGGARNAT